jgi:hypothetical protein
MDELKLLMDYTLFDMGVYITLSALMISLLSMKSFEDRAVGMRRYLICALACFVVAGIFGGVVASNIPYYNDFTAFTKASIGPWFATKVLPASFCLKAEHSAFWLGSRYSYSGFGARVVVNNIGSELSSNAIFRWQQDLRVELHCIKRSDELLMLAALFML